MACLFPYRTFPFFTIKLITHTKGGKGHRHANKSHKGACMHRSTQTHTHGVNPGQITCNACPNTSLPWVKAKKERKYLPDPVKKKNTVKKKVIEDLHFESCCVWPFFSLIFSKTAKCLLLLK